MNLNKRLQNVMKSDAQKRAEFLMSRFCDSGEVFALQSKKDNKFARYIDRDKNNVLVLFPELEFAELFQSDGWLNTTPVSIEIGEFFYEIVPFLIKNQIIVSVFPNQDFSELNLHTPKQLASFLQEKLMNDYDEYYELDYI